MSSFSPRVLILTILLFALATRLPGIMYGLPLHVVADEEVNVYSALKMIQLQTLLPVLHPEAFSILHEPPLLSFVNVLFFIPTATVLYLAAGMPPLDVFADMIALDPTIFFLIARAVTVLLSLGSIYLLYRIALLLFEDRNTAFFSALFLATSFISTTLAATGRHWEITTFLSLLSLLLALLHDKQRPLLVSLSGAVLGLSFGAGYLVFYAPSIGLLILYRVWKETGSSAFAPYFRAAVRFGLPFAAVAVLMIVVAPQPFYKQVITHVLADRHTVFEFLSFYFHTLLYYETLLLAGTMFGVGVLVWQRRFELLAFFSIFFATVLPIMFAFLMDIDRYVHPLLPMLSLLAGHGVPALAGASVSRRSLAAAGILLYAVTVLGRYDVLALRNDTRLQAKQWIDTHVPAGSVLLVETNPLRFPTTQTTVDVLEAAAPGAIRVPDRIAARTRLPIQFTAFHLYLMQQDEQKRAYDAALRIPLETYLIADSWSDATVARASVAGVSPIAVIGNNASIPVPHGLYTGGEEHHGNRGHILKLLWHIEFFGPEVSIFKLD